ncbi:MAG TPA: hypothetical protein VLA03_07695 [Draconibacterium sp.]|nr:hypothetical protein [Draconibacterium sp.]
MKILTEILLLLVLFTTIFWSCEKEETLEPNNQVYITLKNTDDFIHDLKISGDEEGATIKEQATHFSISKIIRNESTGWSVVYQYKPEPDFVGTDSVKIETNTGSDGSGPGNINLTEFFFQITD